MKAIEAYPNISYLEIPYGDVVMPGYLAKSEKGAGFLHMAILVDDFDAKVEQLRLKGFTVHVEESVDPFPGCPLLREAYVLPKDASRGVLIDLMDAENFPVSLGGLAPAKKTDKE
ncbi:hypothetical protein CEE34_08465 [Candidatus Aerophobetes bacterium Ae_b3a]|nr:MAG: hypothetical protein CEE34_08465 [Candidatus Aerophobetes bacterium Ae_b3a]